MSKKKAIIWVSITVVLIVLSIVGMLIYRNNQTDNIVVWENNINQIAENMEIQNTITEENIIENEIESIDNKDAIVEENQIEEKTTETTTTQSVQEKKQQKKSTTTSSGSGSILTSQTTSSNNSKSTIVSQPHTSAVQQQETTKSFETQNTTQTKQETAYWCIDGGTHHIAGDGVDEHGYYTTWEQADAAAKDYMNKNSLYHYKVDSCACGLYYFQAK